MNNNLLILNLKKGATPEQIKYAYRKLVKIWHPDLFYQKYQLREIAEVRLKQINSAYAQLKANNFSECLNQQSAARPSRQRTNPSKRSHFLERGIVLLHALLYKNKNVFPVVVNAMLLVCILSISVLNIVLMGLFVMIFYAILI
ncbi:MAG: J domain-containing protein [bacterium]